MVQDTLLTVFGAPWTLFFSPNNQTWYSAWAPEWTKPLLRRLMPDHISQEELVRQLNEAVAIPGVSNAWTMPVKARTAMLTTGMRTPVGLKISGPDLKTIDEIGARIEALLREALGFEVATFLRSARELRAIAGHQPFDRHHVGVRQEHESGSIGRPGQARDEVRSSGGRAEDLGLEPGAGKARLQHLGGGALAPGRIGRVDLEQLYEELSRRHDGASL